MSAPNKSVETAALEYKQCLVGAIQANDRQIKSLQEQNETLQKQLDALGLSKKTATAPQKGNDSLPLREIIKNILTDSHDDAMTTQAVVMTIRERGLRSHLSDNQLVTQIATIVSRSKDLHRPSVGLISLSKNKNEPKRRVRRQGRMKKTNSQTIPGLIKQFFKTQKKEYATIAELTDYCVKAGYKFSQNPRQSVAQSLADSNANGRYVKRVAPATYSPIKI